MKKIVCLLMALALMLGVVPALADGEPLEIRMTVRLFDQVPDMNNDYWRLFQEKTNTKLDVEWIPDGDYKTKLNLILSSGELPEVICSNASNVLENSALAVAIQNGAFWDLTDYLGDFSKYPNLRDNMSPGIWETGKLFGRNYGVPQCRPVIQGAPLFREDLFQDAGVEIPKTMDDLIPALKAVMDKNPGMIGLICKGEIINNDGGLAAAFGTMNPYFDENGGLLYYKLTPAFTKYVEWLRKAYEAGILSQEFAVMAPTQGTELFESGNAICMVNESIRWCWPFTDKLQKIKEGASVSVLPALEGEKGEYSVSQGAGLNAYMFISSKVPEEKMLAILDYFELTASQEYYDISTYGFEGIHYTVDEQGNKIATEQRNADMGSSAPWQVLPLKYDAYGKVDSTAATTKYNMALRQHVTDMGYFTLGKPNPFNYISSDAWLSVWPRYLNDWSSYAVKAVVGQITMEEYQAYVDSLNQNPQFQEAYKEFADGYHIVFGE